METNKKRRIDGAIPTFKPGDSIVVCNLKEEEAFLNGKTGQLVEFWHRTNHWEVRYDDDNLNDDGDNLYIHSKNLKANDANGVNEVLPDKKVAASLPLKPGDIVTFQNLKVDISLNGKTGRLVEFDGDSGSWRVRCKHNGEELLAKAEHLKAKPKMIEVSDISDQERSNLSCPTHIYVLILDEHNHGWGRGYTEDGKVIGVYISKEAAVSASGEVDTGTFDEAIEPEKGIYSEEGCYIDNRNNPPDDGTLIQLGGKDIGEGDYVRLRIQKKPLMLGLQGTF